jgi:hypothetical protein
MRHSTHPTLSIHIALLTLTFLAVFSILQSVYGDNLPIKFDSSWSFNVHTEYAGANGSLTVDPDGTSLKLSYDFTKGGSFVSADESLDNTGTFTGVEIKTRGPGSFGFSVTDSTDQVFVYTLGSSDDGERTLTINFANDKPWLVHGGPGDKVMHFPLKGLSLLASKSPEHLSGSIEVSEFVLQAPPAPAPANP